MHREVQAGGAAGAGVQRRVQRVQTCANTVWSFRLVTPPASEKSAPGRSRPHVFSIAESTSRARASSSTAMNLARPS